MPIEFAKEIKADLIVRVSKHHTFADLFESFQLLPETESKDHLPHFNYSTGDIVALLTQAEKNIVLYGEFSPELAQRLETLIKGYLRLKGLDQAISSRLVLVSNTNQHFSPVCPHFIDQPVLEAQSTKTVETKASEEKTREEKKTQALSFRIKTSTCVINSETVRSRSEI